MKGKISKIKNTKGELALPVTTVEAVYLEDGKTKLSDEIKDVLKYEVLDDEGIIAEIPDVIEKINGIEKDISEINSSLDNKANLNEVIKKGQVTLDECDEKMLGAIQNKEGETTFSLLSIPRDESVTPKKTVFLEGYNLFNETEAENYKKIDSNGNIIDGDVNEFITDFIPVSEWLYYIFDNLAVGYYISKYDAKKLKIGKTINISNETLGFKKESTVSYLRVSSNKPSLKIFKLGVNNIKNGKIKDEYTSSYLEPVRTKNLFDYSQAVIGLRDSGGYLANVTNWWVSGFINIKGITDIYVNKTINGYSFYDADFSFISKVLAPTMTFKVPENACYCTISGEDVNGATINSFKDIMVSSSPITKYEPYEELKGIPKKISELEFDVSLGEEITTYNLCNPITIKKDFSINNQGDIYTVDASNKIAITDYIPTNENEQLTVSLNGQFLELFTACFDINKKFIQVLDNTNRVMPTGTKYCVFKITEYTDEKLNNIMINKGAGVLPYIKNNINAIDGNGVYNDLTTSNYNIRTWYTDKIIDCLGDSITYFYKYQRYISKALRTKACIAHGIGGSRLSGNYADAMWQDARINSLNPNANFIIVAGGTNDSASWVLGDVSENNFDTNTLCGAINTIIKKLYMKYGNEIPILFVLPPYKREGTVNIKNIVSDMKQILSLWGIPYADLYNNAGINSLNQSAYFSDEDGTHPNEKGHERNARIIVGKLKELEPLI